ncbi:MAG TPA: hypothetical protein VJY35_13570 [Candidatus Eisenbacteria bacterium]|nr:hypothetical protein [Candidatus Eisenbacteria bacterium]
MSARSRLLLVGAGLAAHALLAFGALAFLPVQARIALAFLVLVMLPGFAFVSLGARPPGGAMLAPGWALGFGVAWLGALVLATRALGMPFTILATASLPLHALLWGIVWWQLRQKGRGGLGDHATKRVFIARSVVPEPSSTDAPATWPRAAWVAMLLAAAVGSWNAGRLGAPLGVHTDSPDHIGTIRRMLASGDAFPRDAFFRDAGREGADPRKGLWHPEVALIAKLAAADPLVTWSFLPACLVPLFVLIAAGMGFMVRGPTGAAVAGWAWLLTYGGSLQEQYVREAVFATKLGDLLALATAVAVIADLSRPARALRLAALGLGLGTLAAHVYYALHFAMVFTALGVGLLIADRRWSPRVARLAGTSILLGLAALPYLAWRVSQSYGPVNAIHTETQGILWLADGVPVVSIGVLWDWFGNAWLLFPLAALWLWRAGRANPAVLYLLTTPLAVALVIFDPPVVRLLEPRIGYLLMRMVWMAPLAALLAWVLPGLVEALRRGPARVPAALALLGVAWLLKPALVDSALVLAHPAAQAATERPWGTGPWVDALDWMKQGLPAGSVVLSDPATSYSVPMHTGLYVVTLSDQHSSPNDAHALERILDARDALDPWASWDRVRELLRRHGVDAIALNNRFPSPPPLDYWTPRPSWFAASRARFDRWPAAFERVFDTGDFVVYRVHREALDMIDEPAPVRPFVAPWTPAEGPGRSVDAHLPAILRFGLSQDRASQGDTLTGIADWRATRRMTAGSYIVAVRFDRALPDSARPPRLFAKPARKLIERANGERYRFREDHLPVGGAYGVDLWRPDQVVRDSFTVVVPRDVADGTYRVQIRMLVQPHYANYRLSDYFLDEDYYTGLEVGSLTLQRRASGGAN